MPEGWDAPEFWVYRALHRHLLYWSGAKEYPRLQELADRWITELAEVRLLELDADEEAPLKQADYRRPSLDPREGELYPVRVKGHRQQFWLQVNARPSYADWREHNPIRVLDKPLKTQTAIIALLTALEASPIDTASLREELSQVEPPSSIPYKTAEIGTCCPFSGTTVRPSTSYPTRNS